MNRITALPRRLFGTHFSTHGRINISPQPMGTVNAVVKPIRTRPPEISSAVITKGDSRPPESPTTTFCLFFRVNTSIRHHLSDCHPIHQQKKSRLRNLPLNGACS